MNADDPPSPPPENAAPPDAAESDAHRLAQLLSGLPEMTMRAAVLREHLEAIDPEQAARLLDILVRRGVSGGPPYNTALLALSEVLAGEGIPYELQGEIYRCAKDAGMGELANALFNARSGGKPDGDAVALDPGGRKLTLGERKSLARKPDRGLLERLASDGDPRVIRNLLANPRLTEQDVLKIATRRPANPEVLKEVARSRRWITRYRVKRALVLNPGTPAEIGFRLVPFLNKQDLRLVSESGNLAESLRNAAAQLRERT